MCHLESISPPYSVRMRENTDQKNSEYENFQRSVKDLVVRYKHLNSLTDCSVGNVIFYNSYNCFLLM